MHASLLAPIRIIRRVQTCVSAQSRKASYQLALVVHASLLEHLLQTGMFAERWRTRRYAPTYPKKGEKYEPHPSKHDSKPAKRAAFVISNRIASGTRKKDR